MQIGENGAVEFKCFLYSVSAGYVFFFSRNMFWGSV